MLFGSVHALIFWLKIHANLSNQFERVATFKASNNELFDLHLRWSKLQKNMARVKRVTNNDTIDLFRIHGIVVLTNMYNCKPTFQQSSLHFSPTFV